MRKKEIHGKVQWIIINNVTTTLVRNLENFEVVKGSVIVFFMCHGGHERGLYNLPIKEVESFS